MAHKVECISPSMSLPPIAVLGAGSWGTALAWLLARNGSTVRLWSIESDVVKQISTQHENEKYLPGCGLPTHLQATTDLAESLEGVRDILVVVPSHVFRSVLEQIKPFFSDDTRLLWGTKGLDPESDALLHEVVSEVFSLPIPTAVISGPSFAKEVAMGLPAAVNLACCDSDFTRDLIQRFCNDQFKLVVSSDFVGVQICSVMKNIMAIGVGMTDGLGLGANARAAFMTAGLTEMGLLCEAMGGKSETLLSLAGVGDLILTCTEDLSRNRRFGLALAKGMGVEAAKRNIGQAVEGLQNVQQVNRLAKKSGIKMPIVQQIHAILYEQASPTSLVSSWLG